MTELERKCKELKEKLNEKDSELRMLQCNAQAELELKEENEGLKKQLADSLVHNHKLVEEGKKRGIILCYHDDRHRQPRELVEVARQRDDSIREISRGNDIIKRLQQEVKGQSKGEDQVEGAAKARGEGQTSRAAKVAVGEGGDEFQGPLGAIAG